MNVIFIINPKAGNGTALQAWRKFSKRLDVPYEHYVTNYPGHAAEIVKHIEGLGQKTLLVGFGGDGTMREIAAAAAGAGGLIVASMPNGSGNDYARAFTSFSTAQELRSFLRNPSTQATDIGELCGNPAQFFVSSSGIGFDAAVARAVNASQAKRWLNKVRLGKLAYYLFVVSTLMTFKTFNLRVETENDSLSYKRVWLATVSNQPYFGGGMKISPASKSDDGLLELTIVHRLPRLKLLAVFGTVFSGSHTGFREVVQLGGKQFRLEADRDVPAHIDGDDAQTAETQRSFEYQVAAKKWQQAKFQ